MKELTILRQIIREAFEEVYQEKMLKEDSATFAAKIPAKLKAEGDMWVDKVLKMGGNIMLNYNFINDTREGGLPKSSAEETNWKGTVKSKDTPKSNTYDYIAERLIEIYKNPETSEETKNNILNGLSVMFNTMNPKFIAFLYGSSTSKGAFTPAIPRDRNDKIDYDLIADIMAYIREKIGTPSGIASLIDYYSGTGSFSSLFMNTARLRYKDAVRSSELRSGTGLTDVPEKHVSTLSLDKPLGGAGGESPTTFADMLAAVSDESGSFDSKKSVKEAVTEIYQWVQANQSAKRAEAFKGIVVDGLTPEEIAASPEYPNLTTNSDVTQSFAPLVKNTEFQKIAKEIFAKHLRDYKEKIQKMDVGGWKTKTFEKGAASGEPSRVKQGGDLEDIDYDKYYASLEEEAIKNVLSRVVSEAFKSEAKRFEVIL